MPIIRPDKPEDALFDDLHLINPKCLQITELCHRTTVEQLCIEVSKDLFSFN